MDSNLERIDIERDTDSIDGNKRSLQRAIFFRQLGLILLSGIVVTLFQRLLFWLGNFDYASNFFTWITGWHLIVTTGTCGAFWIWIYLELQLGWVIPKGNTVIPSINIFHPDETEDGATRFIVRKAGFALADLWEEFYRAMDIHREQTHSHKEPKTMSVQGVGLKFKLMIVWKPLLSHLSHYLQNGVDEEQRKKILDAILADAGQAAETIPEDEKWTADEARAKQDELAIKIKEKISPKAAEYGFEIDNVIFEECDYSDKVQEQLDRKKESETIKEMALEIFAASGGSMKHDVAYELAAMISRVPGVERGRTLFEIVADEKVAQAISDAGPAIVAAFAALQSRRNSSN